MPTPIPAIAACDRPLELEPPAAALDDVALAAVPEVVDGVDEVVDEPVVSAVAEDEAVDPVLVVVVAASVAVVEDAEVVAGVVWAAVVLVVVGVDGVAV